jgi:hypothetical protein
MLVRGAKFLCPFGALCAEEELNGTLKRAQVTKYRIKQIDDDPIQDWDKSEWIPVA